MKIDFAMVYHLRSKQTTSLSNLEIQYANTAREKARTDFEVYRSAIAKQLGHDDFEVTNIMCMAEGIMNHVYTPASAQSGVGHKKCIYCDGDDFDF